MENKIKELKEKRRQLGLSDNSLITDKVHKEGKYTAEERIEKFFDQGTYTEISPWIRTRSVDFDLYKKDLRNEGVLSGYGKVDGRDVFLYAHDSTVMGGASGEAGRHKMIGLMDKAIESGFPVIAMNDAAGARIQEGVAALHAYCSLFGKTSIASGWIPQISIVMGLCAGGTAYCSALTDFIIQVEPIGKMFITGPAVIKSVTGEETTFDAIGGGLIHSQKTGLSHFVVNSEEEAFEIVKKLLSYLPSNSKELPPIYESKDSLNRETTKISKLIPEDPLKSFDVKEVINEIVDAGDFLEVQADFAKNMVIGFGRLGGETVGLVANQPKVLAGCIDVDASWKAARFVRFCDSFNIPLITLADTPGYLPGVNQELNGIIRNGAKMLFAYSEATVPKITVVMRKDYGGAYSAMCGKGMGADFVFALPTGEIAIMGADGAAEIVYKKEISSAADKVKKKEELSAEYKKMFLNPYKGAEYGIVDDIIEPKDLRKRLISGLRIIRNKTSVSPFKKHSNIPL